jgi:hypothetical protein
MKGVTPQGQVFDMTPGQAKIVSDVREWATNQRAGSMPVPYMGRQSGKSVLLATIAEYDRRGWPDDLPDEL